MFKTVKKSQQSRWFRTVRKALGLKVKTLAELLEVTPRTINAWENESNENLPSRDKLLIYLALLTGSQELPDPNLLIQLKKSGNGEKTTTDQTWLIYSQLGKNPRFSADLMIHSLYKTQSFFRNEEEECLSGK